MIPYSLVKLKLDCQNSSDKISLEELSPKSMRFYLPSHESFEKSLTMTLTLYFPISHFSCSLNIPCAELSILSRESYRTYWEIRVHDSNYSRTVTEFSKEYLSYISMKTEMDDDEIATNLTDYPNSPAVFCSDLHSWQEKHLSALLANEQWLASFSKVKEISIFLHTPEQYQRYLSTPFDVFLEDYWIRHQLGEHACRKLCINRLYIGSTTCRFLIPSIDEFLRIYQKASAEHLPVSLVFPPMVLGQEDYYRNYFASLNSAVSESPPEMILNDLGAVQYLRELCPSFPIRMGLLMNRTPKDPRAKYLHYQDSSHSSLFRQPSYLHYLFTQFGISYYSIDTMDHANSFAGSAALHLPFSLTNYSPHCTLEAAVHCGDRGCQRLVNSCTHSCRENFFLYPDSTNILGIGNSLWSFNEWYMTSSEIFSSQLSFIDRIVFDFLQEGIS